MHNVISFELKTQSISMAQKNRKWLRIMVFHFWCFYGKARCHFIHSKLLSRVLQQCKMSYHVVEMMLHAKEVLALDLVDHVLANLENRWSRVSYYRGLESTIGFWIKPRKSHSCSSRQWIQNKLVIWDCGNDDTTSYKKILPILCWPQFG